MQAQEVLLVGMDKKNRLSQWVVRCGLLDNAGKQDLPDHRRAPARLLASLHREAIDQGVQMGEFNLVHGFPFV